MASFVEGFKSKVGVGAAGRSGVTEHGMGCRYEGESWLAYGLGEEEGFPAYGLGMRVRAMAGESGLGREEAIWVWSVRVVRELECTKVGEGDVVDERVPIVEPDGRTRLDGMLGICGY
ncbi:unnamed protein product [Dovyalis caffra]|uniref:Uncharacterized protein n=1 Tax=Dovyalis caffra TaxID=77055 RepID=A0AAV1RX32_9ROSI|nr:unnamed protein product [Dovyalis caffra]